MARSPHPNPDLKLNRRRSVGAALLLLAGACGGAEESPSGCADVTEATVTADGAGTYTITATVLSADTGWDKYADAWEVRTPDGTVLGTRVLTHPHVDEQPFTRSLAEVAVPAGIEAVEIAANDSVEGFCGLTVLAEVPRP